MNQFKRAQVVVLPTNNTTNILKGYKDKSLLFKFKQEYKTIEAEKPYVSNFHLYIISDDEIEDGDWYVNLRNKNRFYLNKSGNTKFEGLHDYCKKIIVTTDTSLRITKSSTGYTESRSRTFYAEESLPQPSQQFIEKYIEFYNKGEVITDVLIEYEWYHNKQSCFKTMCYKQDMEGRDSCVGMCEAQRVKINPKDNTITIKKLKDSWNREEVSNLITKFSLELCGEVKEHHRNDWIKKNL